MISTRPLFPPKSAAPSVWHGAKSIIVSWCRRNRTRLLISLSCITTILLTLGHGTEALPEEYSQNDIRYIRQQAEAGDPEAQFSLALLLDQEYGDKQEAIVWFRRAAHQNLAGACLYLGIKYQYGNTVSQDTATAASWYKKAALQGWPSAQYFLGMLYLSDTNIPDNMIQALSWLSIASEHDYPQAAEEKKRILPLLSEQEKVKAVNLVNQFHQDIDSHTAQ